MSKVHSDNVFKENEIVIGFTAAGAMYGAFATAAAVAAVGLAVLCGAGTFAILGFEINPVVFTVCSSTAFYAVGIGTGIGGSIGFMIGAFLQAWSRK